MTSVYLDASVLVSFFIDDANTASARCLLEGALPVMLVSDFGAAEFASAISRRVRMLELTSSDASAVFRAFDRWTEREANRVYLLPADIARAEAILRALDIPLRTPDALHVAIAQRLNASLATFDQKLAECASRMKLALPRSDRGTRARKERTRIHFETSANMIVCSSLRTRSLPAPSRPI